MSGILEQLSQQLATVSQQLAQVLASPGAAAPQALAQPQVQPQALVQPQTLAQPLAAAPAALGGVPAYPAVSAEQITALITPHVGDPNLKAALQAQMAAMGIGALPDAQPHQYGELYARFQQVIQQFTAAAAGVQQPAASPASII